MDLSRIMNQAERVGDRLRCKQCGALSKSFGLSIRHKPGCICQMKDDRTLRGGRPESNRRKH